MKTKPIKSAVSPTNEDIVIDLCSSEESGTESVLNIATKKHDKIIKSSNNNGGNKLRPLSQCSVIEIIKEFRQNYRTRSCSVASNHQESNPTLSTNSPTTSNLTFNSNREPSIIEKVNKSTCNKRSRTRSATNSKKMKTKPIKSAVSPANEDIVIKSKSPLESSVIEIIKEFRQNSRTRSCSVSSNHEESNPTQSTTVPITSNLTFNSSREPSIIEKINKSMCNKRGRTRSATNSTTASTTYAVSAAYEDLVILAHDSDNHSLLPFGSDDQMRALGEYITLTPISSPTNTRSRSSSMEFNPTASTTTPTKFAVPEASENLETFSCSSESSKFDFHLNRHLPLDKHVKNRSCHNDSEPPTKCRADLKRPKVKNVSDATDIIVNIPNAKSRVLYVDGGGLPFLRRSSQSSNFDFNSNRRLPLGKHVKNRSVPIDLEPPTKCRAVLKRPKVKNVSNATGIIVNIPTAKSRVLYVDGGGLPFPRGYEVDS